MKENKVKETTEKYIDIVLQQAEDKAGISMTESMVESTEFIDKLSNSLLIVSGAALTLSIGNSEAVISALGKGSFKALIIFLLLSAVAGFIAKASHSISIMSLNLAKDLISKFDAIFDEFEKFEEEQIEKVKDLVEIEPRSPNMERVTNSFVATLPSFLQKKVRNSIVSQDGDGKGMQRAATTLAYTHLICFGAQALLTVIAFVSAVFGVE